MTSSSATLWTLASIGFGVSASTTVADVLAFDFELGVSPASAGWTSAGPVSGTFALAGGVPGLGSHVWEASVHGAAGGYLYDLSSVATLDAGFRLRGFVRGLTVLPQGGAVGTIERNRPSGSAVAARGSSLAASQWYLLEVSRWPGAERFAETRWLVNHQSGAVSLISSLSTPLANQGSPGSDLLGNSIAFYAANDGSSFLRTQFDNIRFEPMNCIADFDLSGEVSVQDLFDFLSLYFEGHLRADVNDSGDLSTQDIFDFLAAFFGGCD